MIMTETCQHWNPLAGEWETVTVEVTPEPVRPRRSRARRSRRPGAACDLAGLSDSAPFPDWWRDTAYAPSDGLADMRTFVKPAAIRTHRAATVMPADPGRITETGRRA